MEATIANAHPSPAGDGATPPRIRILPDYALLSMVQKLSDGADAHKLAQQLNIYSLAIHALNEPSFDADRAELDATLQQAAKILRIFVTRKRLDRGERP
jgi:hypothetical protein